jgi:hypothetical protein
MKEEKRGRKPHLPQTIEVWYKNEFEKLRYKFAKKQLLEKEFQIQKKELLIEKTQREVLELLQKENQK